MDTRARDAVSGVPAGAADQGDGGSVRTPAVVPEQSGTDRRSSARSGGPGPSRRSFLGGVSGVAVVGLAGGVGGGLAPLLAARPAAAGPPAGSGGAARQRAHAAYKVREAAAKYERDRPLPVRATNGDEQLPGHVGSYSKALPHDDLGQVDGQAYAALLAALGTGSAADMEQVPLGGRAKLGNPLSAWCFELDAPDSHHLELPAPPALGSRQRAAEMAEVYWQALTRDVPFGAYDSDPLIARAAEDLSALAGFPGPRVGGQVTPGTLFRGTSAGDLTGPYLSQFLWREVPWGPGTIEQRYRAPLPGSDHGTDPDAWLALQRGAGSSPPVLDPVARYVHDGRSLASWVHTDFSYQAFLSAALILLAIPGTTDARNPYRAYTRQGAFGTFGGPFVLDLVAGVACSALHAAWMPKWLVHRTLRPEVFAGRLHHQLAGHADYGLHEDIVSVSRAPAAVKARTGNVLLSQVYPEASPTHPSYPAGHATVAGACVTVLKACMDETFVLPDPVMVNADGTALQRYHGADLTVGGELDKLASNISLGRDAAGVHYRSDAVGMLLGEQLALGVLTEMRDLYREPFGGFTLTRFDGTRVTV